MGKICNKCGVLRPYNRFSRHPKAGDGYAVVCKECINARHREAYKTNPKLREKRLATAQKWREANPEKIKETNQRNYWKNPETHRARARNARVLATSKIRQLYGEVCACCGETEKAFLTVDHINRDGKQDRERFSSSVEFRKWLSKQSKLEGYQILCFNCNLGRERNNGICPHKMNSLIQVA